MIEDTLPAGAEFVSASDGGTLVGNKVVECNSAALEMLHCRDKEDLLSRQPSTLSPEYQPDGSRSAEKANEMDTIARAKGSSLPPGPVGVLVSR